MSADSPIQIPHPESVIPLLDPATSYFIGGIWGNVTGGQTWIASDGERFVWSADGLEIIYSQDRKFFVQTPRGFANEVRTYPLVAAGRSAAPWARVAQIEMKFLMGVVAGASGVGFAVVVGTEIAEFVIENRDEFAKWEHQLEVVLRARAILKDHAPVLYDKVFNAVLNQVFKDVKGNIPDAVTPEVVFFGIGVVFGSVGKKLSEGKFSWFALIFVVVEQLAIRLTIGVVPQAIKITEGEYRKMADEIMNQLRKAGVTIQDADMRKIVEEVQKNPGEIKQAFDMMRDAFQQVAAPAAH
jgi:hypothetical protein